MTRGTFFFSGRTPFEFRILATRLVKDEDFIEDAMVLLRLDKAKVDDLSAALTTGKSFIDRGSLRTLVADVLGPNSDVNDVVRIVWRISSLIHDGKEPLPEKTRLLRKAILDKFDKIEESERLTLWERIEALAVSPKSLTRQHKAQQLAEATGFELESATIVCDIRPVFDESRSVVEGAISVAMLRLDLVEPDGLPQSLEIRLNEAQIDQLLDVAQHAKGKLISIKKLLENKSIIIPTINNASATGGTDD